LPYSIDRQYIYIGGHYIKKIVRALETDRKASLSALFRSEWK